MTEKVLIIIACLCPEQVWSFRVDRSDHTLLAEPDQNRTIRDQHAPEHAGVSFMRYQQFLLPSVQKIDADRLCIALSRQCNVGAGLRRDILGSTRDPERQ